MLLDVKNLSIQFDTPDGAIHAVRDISFQLDKHQALGVVGESGSGKSQTMLGLLGLLASNGRISGQALFNGQDLIKLSPKQLNRIRGDKIGLIFQDPMTSLNPYLNIATQMVEVLQAHRGLSKGDALAQSVAMLDAVKIPQAAQRIKQYPYEFSGGQRQRIMIAMALLCKPELLIADEPTTALDVTVQAEILELLRELRREMGISLIMITHDLGVAAEVCDEIQVMRHGEILERKACNTLFEAPDHDYSRALLQCIPRLNDNRRRLATVEQHADSHADNDLNTKTKETLLTVQNLRVEFPAKPKPILAVNDVSFEIKRGEVLGIVGESGSGKSTVARAILGLNQPHAGNIVWQDKELLALSAEEYRPLRKQIQVVFQDPLASLNPRMSAGDIIGEPLRHFQPKLSSVQRLELAASWMEKVGLERQWINRYPHEFSGGQCQRIGIARALIIEPELLICDEPVSALDVSVQAQVVNLLQDLQQQLGLSLLFIAHDLSVVKHISDRILVMRQGEVVEVADKHSIYDNPQHPYTQALIASIPELQKHSA